VDKNLQDTFLSLVRLGIGLSASNPHVAIDWQALQDLAMGLGLHAILLDGIEKLPLTSRPPQEFLLEWIGLVMQGEACYAAQHKAAKEMFI
jgi:hypothetical protein